MRRNTPGWKDHREKCLMGLDPGETTGYALWKPDDSYIELRQLQTNDVLRGATRLDQEIGSNFIAYGADDNLHIVMEDYKVYQWKVQDHAWDPLHTAQLIGATRYNAYRSGISCHMQMAVVAKRFVTDAKLEQWGLYSPGLNHARDAQRHLLHYFLFGT
jgi:hypothetical protein